MEFDLESDLWNQAEFTRSYVEPPPSLAKRKGRTSIFDDEPEELIGNVPPNGTESRVKMIRGRPVKVKNDDRPGGLDVYKKTQKDIREVCGVGYSNELIETYIRSNQRNNEDSSTIENNPKEVKMPDLSFKKLSRRNTLECNGNKSALYPLEETTFKLSNESDFPSLK